jgi:hypothetical protein
MPNKKSVPYRRLIQLLLASKKLSKPEQLSFEKLAKKKKEELDTHQKLWIETLSNRYLLKSV